MAEADLALKAELEFTFDYGDTWKFKVRLEKVVTGPGPYAPEVVGSAGTPPKQYPQAEG